MLLVKYILSSVCIRLSQLSQLTFVQYMAPCVFSLPISLVMIARIQVLYLIIISKSEVWTTCPGPLYFWLDHETTVCAVGALRVFLYSHQIFRSIMIGPVFQCLRKHEVFRSLITYLYKDPGDIWRTSSTSWWDTSAAPMAYLWSNKCICPDTDNVSWFDKDNELIWVIN